MRSGGSAVPEHEEGAEENVEAQDVSPEPESASAQPPGRRARKEERHPALRTLGTVAMVLLLVALARTFVVQTYLIPSGSMEDTLMEGDRVAVTMYDSSQVTRGDVVVFRDPDSWLTVTEPTGLQGLAQNVLETIHLLPQDAGHHLIKRVIGLPGDHVVADGNGSLSVNGVPVSEPYLKPGRSASEVAFDVVVPEGCVWVMGDNRGNSADSRYHQDDAHAGAVPLSEVVGVAKAVVWPADRWTGLQDGEKVFTLVPDA